MEVCTFSVPTAYVLLCSTYAEESPETLCPRESWSARRISERGSISNESFLQDPSTGLWLRPKQPHHNALGHEVLSTTLRAIRAAEHNKFSE